MGAESSFAERMRQRRIEDLRGHIHDSLDLANQYWEIITQLVAPAPTKLTDMPSDIPENGELSAHEKKVLRSVREIKRQLELVQGYLNELAENSSVQQATAYLQTQLTSKAITFVDVTYFTMTSA